MKKIHCVFLLVMALVLTSCSSDEDSTANTDNNITISNNPLSGKLYGKNFTIGGGKASIREVFGVESVEIYMTAQDLGCETLGFSDFPITVVAPNKTGVFTTDIYVTFNDPDSSSYLSLSLGNMKVEITSITEDHVTGKVFATDKDTENTINGKFDIGICE